MFRQIVLARYGISGDRNGGGGCFVNMPCEHALPPLEIVGGKISGMCIDEASLWPLEPLSATPPPKFAGAPRAPLPPSKIFTSPGLKFVVFTKCSLTTSTNFHISKN